MNIDYEDKSWFCQKVLLHKGSLYRLALSILQNQQDAEDALQQAICISYEKLDTLRNPDSFRPWIMKILSNTAYGMLRSRHPLLSIDQLGGIFPNNDTDHTTRLSLWEAVCSLGRDYQIVVVLFYYEDMTVKDICTITGLTESTVKTRLSRARQKLKLILDEGDKL